MNKIHSLKGKSSNHKPSCQCFICKAKRHENKGVSYEQRFGKERAKEIKMIHTLGAIKMWKKRQKTDWKMPKRILTTLPQTLCLCGCGQITNPGKIYIHNHHWIGKTYEELYGNRAREEVNKRNNHKPNCNCFICKAKRHESLEHKLDCQCGVCQSKRGERKGVSYDEFYGPERAKIEIQKRFSTLIANRLNWFMGIPFASNEEKKVAKLLFKKLEIVPIPNINCHVRVGTKIIDFYFYGMFIEYHPMDTFFETRTNREDYYNDRRNFLDKSGYKKYPLIHLITLKEVGLLMNFLRDSTPKRN